MSTNTGIDIWVNLLTPLLDSGRLELDSSYRNSFLMVVDQEINVVLVCIKFITQTLCFRYNIDVTKKRLIQFMSGRFFCYFKGLKYITVNINAVYSRIKKKWKPLVLWYVHLKMYEKIINDRLFYKKYNFKLFTKGVFEMSVTITNIHRYCLAKHCNI